MSGSDVNEKAKNKIKKKKIYFYFKFSNKKLFFI